VIVTFVDGDEVASSPSCSISGTQGDLVARLAGSLSKSVLQPHVRQKAASVERVRLWRSVEPVPLSQ
jgi:hypothetical protein